MENMIYVKNYPSDEETFPVNEREVLRYSGYMGYQKEVEPQLFSEFLNVKKELKDAFSFKVCYRRMELVWEDGYIVGPINTKSKDLAKSLRGCKEVYLFAATIGLNIDRSIARWQRISPVKALFGQAYGAERVETLCDFFCNEIKREVQKEGLFVTPRFSPGYGDLPLTVQKDFFSILDCNRQIGISLNESLLMTPSKSVTAMFGVSECETVKRGHQCSLCNKTDCAYRTKESN